MHSRFVQIVLAVPALFFWALISGCDDPVRTVQFIDRPLPPTDLVGRLAYATSSARPGESGARILVTDFDRKYTYSVIEFDGMRIKDLAWSPVGSRITYAGRETGSVQGWRLFSISEEGLNLTEHFPVAGAIDLTHPSWSVSGRLAYVQSENEMDALFIDGEKYFAGVESISRPSLSSNETYIIAGTEDSNTIDFFRSSIDRINLDGDGIISLIEDTSTQEQIDHYALPAISPDGTRLTFVRQPAGSEVSEIWTMDIDGANAAALTSGSVDSYPVWSPDARYIAFQRDRDLTSPTGEPGGIFVIRPGGTNETQITFDNGKYPTWTW